MSEALSMNRARRAYEWGRLRSALARGVVLTGALAIVAAVTLGVHALPWLAIAFAAIVFGEWRGSFFGAGARRGFLLGAIALLLPLSILRPCCAGKEMAGEMMGGAACCTMPSMCGLAGVVLGVSVTLLWPKAPRARQPEVALGTLLGAAGIFAVRCSGMFAGEALGLVAGLAGGVLASAVARAWLDRRLT